MKRRVLSLSVAAVLVAFLYSVCLAETDVSLSPMDQIFYAVDLDTTYQQAMKLIEESGLYYSVREFNGTPKKISIIASDIEAAAKHSYAASGDSIQLCFDKGTNALLYMQYCDDKTLCSALLYSYGTYWDFREKEPNNQYTGLYYQDPMDFDKNGIVMVYSNGNSTKTNYYPFEDKASLLERLAP